MNENGPLEPDALQRLRALGGADLLRDVLDAFLRNLPKRLAEARAGLAAGNVEPVRRNAHSLKTGCAHVGALAARDAAARLEQAARTNEPATLAGLLDDLEQALQAARPALEAARPAGSP